MSKKSKEEKAEVKTKKSTSVITPLKSFKFKFAKQTISLEKGKETEVHNMFLPNLKTENVIK